MTYSNYVNNGTTPNTGTNPNTYTNYANAQLTVSPYGYWITGVNIPTAYTIGTQPTYSNYVNYNNWTRPAPAAYTITSAVSSFAAGSAIDDAAINTLQTDISNLSVTKVQSTGAVIATTPTTTNVTAGSTVSRGIINEMITNLGNLWTTIRGGTVSGLPAAKASGDSLTSTDMTAIVNKTQEIANTNQPRLFAGPTGYLNCAHWTNTAGVNNPGTGFGAAGAQTPIGTDTYAGGNR